MSSLSVLIGKGMPADEESESDENTVAEGYAKALGKALDAKDWAGVREAFARLVDCCSGDEEPMGEDDEETDEAS